MNTSATAREGEGGLGKYSPKAFEDFELGEYRTRFPDETKALSDEQIFNIVSHTDDDLDDDAWRSLFLENAA